jgi:tetratricopeptide (TPR) repeat protein
VVDVVGEAGVGKSRLVYEFQKRIAGEATVLAGVCLHYGRNINFLPLTDMVKGAFGIEPGMTEEEAGKRIGERAQGSLSPFLPFYRNLLSLMVEDPKFNSLNPEGRKFGTFEAVKNLLLSLSDARPLLIFLEDVHWMDKISEDFFTFLSRSFLDRPILMLSAYRPEVTPSWAQGSHYQRLGLETLSMNSSIRLVMNILGGLELEPALEGKIAEKAGGNPFFIEEIVRELMERGDLVRKENRYVCRHPIDQLEIPGTIQGVIAARMDRLSEDLKRTMQVASVIGRDFAFRLLKSILQLGEELRGHLTNLVGLEVLYEKALYPELEYIFKHALTQEVAYDSLLKQRRREIHGRIAKAIEELYADKLEPHYELLAHHYELSDTPDRAIDYLVLAGEKANRDDAAAAAGDFFNRALKLMEKSKTAEEDPGLMLRIRTGRASSLHAMGQVEEPRQDYLEAIRLARQTGDRLTTLDLIERLGSLIYNTTRRDEVTELLEQGFHLAREAGDKAALSRLMSQEAYYRTLWHHSDETERFQEALRLAIESGDTASIMMARGLISLMERWMGRPMAAVKLSEGNSEYLQSSAYAYWASSFSIVHGLILADAGKYQEAIGFLKKWMEISEKNSLYGVLGRQCNVLAWAYSEIYDLEKALPMNKRSLDLARRLRTIPARILPSSKEEAMAEVNLMENKFDIGLPDEALQDMIRFGERVRSDPSYDLLRHRWDTRMKDLKATILLGKGDVEGAEALAEECLRVAAEKGMKKYVGKAHRQMGRIGTEKKAFGDAESHLRTALDILEEVGNSKQLWLTRSALASLYGKMDRTELEREQWQTAKAVVERTAAELVDQELRKTFLNAAPIRTILERAGV